MAGGRKVNRGNSGRQAAVRGYSDGGGYRLPFWAKEWIVRNAHWVAILLTILYLPVVALAVVLGINKLPLAFLGIPSSASDISGGAVALIIQFILIALAIKPLERREMKGWNLLAAAAITHTIYDIVFGHYVTAVVITGISFYILLQIRSYYKA
ncbi:MAG TPA: hypothetical protein VNA68_00615 [Candidatus Dormibacteraeota bacterium]|nr:hypothetical protein [Candidatus Dormibacteraeota bacterium]